LIFVSDRHVVFEFVVYPLLTQWCAAVSLHSLEQLADNLPADVLCPDVDRGTPAGDMLQRAIERARLMLLLDKLPAGRSTRLVLRDIAGPG
jgi:hypothetical protein